MGASRFRQIRILQSHSSAPPRTYLLAAQSDQRQHLAGCRCAEESGDGARIVRRVDLHYVASDDLQPGQAPKELQASQLVKPPTSGVPVPGAKAGSTKSTSKET